MNDEKNKLKEAFELSDLLHSKRKDEIIEGLEEKLSEISEVFVKPGTFYGSKHIKNHLKERVKRIKEIVNKRLNLDIHYIQKSKISFNDDIYQEINKRVLDAIESEIESASDKMLHFCRNWPSPRSYFELINQELDNKKDILIKNAERNIKIHKMRNEQEVKENKITENHNNDYKKYKYKCYYKINIIGKDEDLKKENFIEIDGNGIELGKHNFIIFVKLALELKGNNEGWVDIELFVQETDLSFTGIYQLIGRLRENLMKIKALDNDSVKELIENKKSGFYRISTHPDFITFNKEKLLNHQDPKIRKLAEELP